MGLNILAIFLLRVRIYISDSNSIVIICVHTIAASSSALAGAAAKEEEDAELCALVLDHGDGTDAGGALVAGGEVSRQGRGGGGESQGRTHRAGMGGGCNDVSGGTPMHLYECTHALAHVSKTKTSGNAAARMSKLAQASNGWCANTTVDGNGEQHSYWIGLGARPAGGCVFGCFRIKICFCDFRVFNLGGDTIGMNCHHRLSRSFIAENKHSECVNLRVIFSFFNLTRFCVLASFCN